MVWIALHYVAVLAVAARVLLRPHRDPSARVAWLAVLFSLPVVGVVAYPYLQSATDEKIDGIRGIALVKEPVAAAQIDRAHLLQHRTGIIGADAKVVFDDPN